MHKAPHFLHVGILRRRAERLKLYVLGDAFDVASLDHDLVCRFIRGVTIVPAIHGPATGFAALRAEIGAIWRCAFYLWSADGLSRSVLHVDLESGLRMTAPDAAFHVGCVAEVHLIAEEFRAWRSACGRADALERYLEDVAA